uniref:Mitochondrial import inner membrane translocase subunit TIM50 n=1 Tax=Pseudo-nitzschia australis TaxID=44445 RepID=A0A7S4A958_9STRA|mmetsp:Transcript_19556/g.42534  ORF Transcript_19556/g.42534 Transcript_19556/m.42534 type:complete len:347 (-) Transcript_19556:177-1217(-)|eukprot:CAMPEP_0168191954 /NCGR_PEP_ID=MMETSP0139_2-20121125/17791_1 /TAXON_ID=44445 /ORGANISM="Pseudo-nitzschia australis, Strain 10249 10 AB" /LENGTH=346 /DNA_ID=CAMNT_0008115163 /DNA_START=97 /DNA_END=1137 /DNA_ORIENTATION=+
MACIRVCALKTFESSRLSRVIYNTSRVQSSSLSSWISPSKRNQRYDRRRTQQQWRPVVNGKSLPLHVKDLKAHQITGAFSFPSQQQQRQKHRLRNKDIKPRRNYESDLVVVLDMDECLIHSQFLQGPGAKYAHQLQQRGSSSLDGGTTKTVDTFNITLPDGERVLVHERPHLHEFLREVSSKYETHIFTAAMEVYAKPVLKMLDPHGEIFSGIHYRESCELDATVGAYIKNLGLFCESCDEQERQQRLNRTVLVDNNPLSFLANPEHGILVSSFYDDSRDTTLPAVLDLLHELDKHDDVRPVLDARFQLREALNDIARGRPFAGRHQQIDEQQDDQDDHAGFALAT